MVDKQWASSVHQHYGREPYWTDDPSKNGTIRLKASTRRKPAA